MPGKEIKGRSKIATYRHGGRAGFQSGKKVFGDPKYHKEAEKRKQAREVRDVKGKVIPERGPHSTYAGRASERARGYLRKHKKFIEAAEAESKSRNRRTYLGVIRKKGGKV